MGCCSIIFLAALALCFFGPGGAFLVFFGAFVWKALQSARQGNIESDTRSFKHGNEGWAGNSDQGAYELQRDFISCLFAMMTKIAMADGTISQPEVDAINLYAKKTFNHKQRLFIKYIIAQTRRENKPPEYYLDIYARGWTINPALVEIFLTELCIIAVSDGSPSDPELRLLAMVEKRFGMTGFTASFLRQFFGGRRQGGHYGQDEGGYDSYTEDMGDYYATLGCSENATDAEVKSAYRAKCKEYHPDILQSKGLPPELINKAQRKMQEINEAYQKIKQARNMA